MWTTCANISKFVSKTNQWAGSNRTSLTFEGNPIYLTTSRAYGSGSYTKDTTTSGFPDPIANSSIVSGSNSTFTSARWTFITGGSYTTSGGTTGGSASYAYSMELSVVPTAKTVTTGTTYLTRASTSATNYLTRVSTSGTTYQTRASTSGTTYQTRASTSNTIYYTRASTSGTTYLTRISTSATVYQTRASTSGTTYLTRASTSGYSGVSSSSVSTQSWQ